MNILQVKKYYLLIKKVKEQARFTYSPLEKVVDWSELQYVFIGFASMKLQLQNTRTILFFHCIYKSPCLISINHRFRATV